MQESGGAHRPKVPSHLVSKMNHNEGNIGHAWLLEVCTARVLFEKLLGPVLISSLWHLKERVS